MALSGPMRRALRQTRAAELRALYQELREVQAKIGQPRFRTIQCVQRRTHTVLKRSCVGRLVRATVVQDDQGCIRLDWQIDRDALHTAMRPDGRYLLVTNEPSLSAQRMFELYRAKDGVEKRFRLTKSDLRVSPIYVHKDTRIEGLLLVNMLALLAYSLLERQVRQAGWQITTRQIIARLTSLDVIETWCWDGSVTYRIVPVDAEQAGLLDVLAHLLAELRHPHPADLQLSSGTCLPLALPPPRLPAVRAGPVGAAEARSAGKGELCREHKTEADTRPEDTAHHLGITLSLIVRSVSCRSSPSRR